MPSYRFHQPDVVQRGRMQLVDQPSYVGNRSVDDRTDLGDERSGRIVREVHHRVGAEPDPGQRRTQPVMQILPQPTSLLLARGDKSPPRLLRGVGQRLRSQRHPERRRH